jgi:hypothetical protein
MFSYYQSLPPKSNICGLDQKPTIRVESRKGLSLWNSLALPANIRLGWKLIEVAITPVYYNTATITAVNVL